MNKLKAINTVQYSLQLLTALLLLFFTINSDTPERVAIPILLIFGWTLGFAQRRITRRRVNRLRKNDKKDAPKRTGNIIFFFNLNLFKLAKSIFLIIKYIENAPTTVLDFAIKKQKLTNNKINK